ncbi:MAG: hypothetical protein RSB65_04365, partial [Oscillospiraceae bacterium]
MADMVTSITDENTLVSNQGKHPLVNFNFMLRVEALFDLPCKSVHAFTRELEYEFIQEGGLNDYVHMRRKPISKPFTLEIERYVGLDYFDCIPLGADLVLPLMLFVSRYVGQFIPFVVARTYVFTGCTVMKKTFGELDGDKSGLLIETTTFGYREMLCVDIPWSMAGQKSFPAVDTSKGNTDKNNLDRIKQLSAAAFEKIKEAKQEAEKLIKETAANIQKIPEAKTKSLEREDELKKAVTTGEQKLPRAKTAQETAKKKVTEAKALVEEKRAALANKQKELDKAQSADTDVRGELRQFKNASQAADFKAKHSKENLEKAEAQAKDAEAEAKELEASAAGIQSSLSTAKMKQTVANRAFDDNRKRISNAQVALEKARADRVKAQAEFDEANANLKKVIEEEKEAESKAKAAAEEKKKAAAEKALDADGKPAPLSEEEKKAASDAEAAEKKLKDAAEEKKKAANKAVSDADKKLKTAVNAVKQAEKESGQATVAAGSAERAKSNATSQVANLESQIASLHNRGEALKKQAEKAKASSEKLKTLSEESEAAAKTANEKLSAVEKAAQESGKALEAAKKAVVKPKSDLNAEMEKLAEAETTADKKLKNYNDLQETLRNDKAELGKQSKIWQTLINAERVSGLRMESSRKQADTIPSKVSNCASENKKVQSAVEVIEANKHYPIVQNESNDVRKAVSNIQSTANFFRDCLPPPP